MKNQVKNKNLTLTIIIVLAVGIIGYFVGVSAQSPPLVSHAAEQVMPGQFGSASDNYEFVGQLTIENLLIRSVSDGIKISKEGVSGAQGIIDMALSGGTPRIEHKLDDADGITPSLFLIGNTAPGTKDDVVQVTASLKLPRLSSGIECTTLTEGTIAYSTINQKVCYCDTVSWKQVQDGTTPC